MPASQSHGQQPTPLAIFAAIQSYQRTFLLKAAVELDVFTAVASGKSSAGEIAAACGASDRGTRILCDALTAMGLLAKEGSRYSLPADSAFFLDRRSPAYLGNAMKFLLHPSQIESMAHLADAVRRGGAPEGHSTLGTEAPVWEDFARGMVPLMKPIAEAVAQSLRPALAGKALPKILDIAAGHGMFGITVAQQFPAAQIYAVDWANVLSVADENASRLGIADRHHLIPGDAFAVDFGHGHDAVLLTNFLHHFSPADNIRLLRKCFQAMNAGAQVVIVEFVPNEDHVSPPGPVLFSAAMLSSTPEGEAYTFRELSDMCRNAGFERLQLVSLEPLPQSLVLARKAD